MSKDKKQPSFRFVALTDLMLFIKSLLVEDSKFEKEFHDLREFNILKSTFLEELDIAIEVAYERVRYDLKMSGVSALTKRQSKRFNSLAAILDTIIGSLVAKHNKLKIHLNEKSIYFDNHQFLIESKQFYPMMNRFVTGDLSGVFALMADFVACYNRNSYSPKFLKKITSSGCFGDERLLWKELEDKIDLLEFKKINSCLKDFISELLSHSKDSKVEHGFNSDKNTLGLGLAQFEQFLESVLKNIDCFEANSERADVADELSEQLEDLSILISNQLMLFKSAYPYAHSFNLSCEKGGFFEFMAGVVLAEDCFFKEKKLKEVVF